MTMAIDLMPKSDEQKIGHALDRMISLVDTQEQDPTDALVKASSELKLTAAETKLAGQAYNQGRTVMQLQKESAAERCGVVSLAHPDMAVARMFPERPSSQASKVSNETRMKAASCGIGGIDAWAAPQRQEKVAAAPVIDEIPMFLQMKIAERTLTRSDTMLKLADDIVAGEALACKLLFASAVHEVKVAHAAGRDVGAYMDTLRDKHGDAIEWLVEKLATASGIDKRAFDISRYTLSDFDRGGYGSVEGLLKRSVSLHAAAAERKRLAGAKEAAETGRAEVHIKRASEEGGKLDLAGALGALKGEKSILPGTYKQLEQASIPSSEELRGRLMDPNVRDNQMRIETQTMLHDLMANDDVIKHHPEADVLKHFNTLVEAYPTIVKNRGALTSELRRGLGQGHFEAADLAQVSKLAPKLQDSYSGGLLSFGGQHEESEA